MSISFSSGELINIAIGIERRGIAFYDIMARSTEDITACGVFQHLADMEREHIRIFQSMLGEADSYQIPGYYVEEYAAYFKVLVDSAVFTDDMVASEVATQADSDIKAMELAIAAEKDSILFYYEMRNVVSPKVQPAVDRILTEEKSHLSQLSELKKKLTAT
jgi:rubrerythrin